MVLAVVLQTYADFAQIDVDAIARLLLLDVIDSTYVLWPTSEEEKDESKIDENDILQLLYRE